MPNANISSPDKIHVARIDLERKLFHLIVWI